MKKVLTLALIIPLSIILLYISLFIGELIVSCIFFIAAVLYMLNRRREASLRVVSILLVEAVLVLLSYTIIHKFDEMLKDVFKVDQVYPIKPNQLYKSIMISIENITSNSPINAAEIYLEYDKEEVTIIHVKPQDQFLKITLSSEVDKELGGVYIAGGLPNPGYTSKSALFAQVFLSQSANSKNELRIGKKSRILANDGAGTDLSAIKDGPYFKLNETVTTNTITSEDTANSRKVLNVNGFESRPSKSRINIIARLLLALNSKVLKK